ncbi:DUF427 domain-containing protein [Nostocoides sp. F2B08]|uniref:DUF427 domain-containing protein n=1 Tax=Nostocoides sp. F2B08 TaxID=2653936 RepID=UPI0012630989|nr:DUF427 domain-containing protein [Tetrasphaera sp. F2B08]KAB7744098.1 DUF427 domain-containing protein [Tetrasphaera sp. F2B08]
MDDEPIGDQATPGVESVWDYPRPPAVRTVHERVEIWFGGEHIAACDEAVQVLETSHPPTYYLPQSAFEDGALVPVRGTTFCEFKGVASYFDVVAGGRTAERAAWHYPDARGRYAVLLGHVAVMPGLMDRCTVDGEEVVPQEGGFYGGWITSKVTGPFKGAPGTLGW